MRRIAALTALIVGVGLLLAVGTGASDDSGYQVRAIFDNGGFLVPGEEVRIAGARVGQVDSVDVTDNEEEAHADGSPDPGKAVVVLDIEDPAFQDFRSDASCLIRPQSLLGEKFVECKPTEPRAPGSQAPPPLKTVPEGQPGAGQHFLPIEQNGKAVDLDLVNDIQREPYADRFRLIINDLGAGLAARGPDLAEVVRRADPALRETDEVLKILADQNRQLATLAKDSDTILAPLVRQRQRISGFINNAATTAQATAERSADLEAGLQKLPPLLRELRPTMTQLNSFAVQSTPVIADLRLAAPDLTRITKALGPFSRGGTKALTSLGEAGAKAGPKIVAADPIVKKLKRLAKNSEPVATELSDLLDALKATGGYRDLMHLIFNTTGSINSFDSYGHFLRTLLPFNNCVNYTVSPLPGCGSIFSGASKNTSKSPVNKHPKGTTAKSGVAEALRALRAGALDGGGSAGEPGTTTTSTTTTTTTDSTTTTPEDTGTPEEQAATADAPKMRDAQILLDYFMGGQGRSGEGER